MPVVDFTDQDWRSEVEALGVAADVRDWVFLQISRGADYYSRRISRLGLRGGRVLDAGSGMGSWSLGLLRHFDEVEALDLNPEFVRVATAVASRLDGRLRVREGSVEDLPFEDSSFDAVFCNGVVFLTRVERTLAEFRRVLRGRGTLYLTFNAQDWWRHLILVRGPTEPSCVYFGCNALIGLVFRYLDRLAFEARVRPATRSAAQEALLTGFGGSVVARLTPRPLRLSMALSSLAAAPRGEPGPSEIEETILALARSELAEGFARGRDGSLASEVRALLATLWAEGPGVTLAPESTDYRRRLAVDLAARLALGRPEHRILVPTHSFEPEEMAALLSDLGFRRIAAAPEGGLSLVEEPPVAPIYTRDQGVWEILAEAPPTEP